MRTVNTTLSLVVALLMAVILPNRSYGAYVLDNGFGDRGVTVTGFDNFDDRAHDIALLKDGRILVVGVSDNGADTDVAVARYNRDGSLDTTFSNDGKATFQVGSGDDGGYAVAVGVDGTIIIGGYAVTEEIRNIALLRLTANGFPDLDFGISGQVVLQLEDGGGEIRDLLIDEENRILVAGNLFLGEREYAMAARFLDDGDIDDSFGEGGVRRLHGGEASEGNVVALQSDGRIIVAGGATIEGIQSAAFFRLHNNGTIDTSFGSDGLVVLGTDVGASVIRDLIIVEDDSLVVAGSLTVDEQKNVLTAKFSGTGIPDQDFGSGGLTITSVDDGSAYAIAQKEDGSFIIVGEAANGGNTDMLFIHLDRQGEPMSSTALMTAGEVWQTQDSSSTVNIFPLTVRQESSPESLGDYQLLAARAAVTPLLTDIAGEDESGRAVIIREGGTIFVAGFTSTGRDDDFVLAGYVDDIDPSAVADGEGLPQPYLLATLSVTNVTRNSAMSGGVISNNVMYTCGSLTDDDCRPKITGRGVVYGVTSYPVYRITEETGTGDQSTSDDTNKSVFPEWATSSSHNYELVRSGQTSDGSGSGTFGSDITEVTPDVVYYLRAYAVLEDETVIYGNQLTFKTDDACFIATAAYGSILEGHVAVLRQFRDVFLLTNRAGSEFVRFYYGISPALADVIDDSAMLRYGARMVLMPVVIFGYFMLHTSMQVKILCLLLLGLTYIFVNRIPSRRHNCNQ